MTEVPHFSLPFKFQLDQNGEMHACENEQDSIDDITDCVEAIVRCPLGYRIELPEFGIRDQTFSEGGLNVEEIQVAITQWEPRADVLIEDDETYLEQFVSVARIKPNKITVLNRRPEQEEDDNG